VAKLIFNIFSKHIFFMLSNVLKSLSNDSEMAVHDDYVVEGDSSAQGYTQEVLSAPFAMIDYTGYLCGHEADMGIAFSHAVQFSACEEEWDHFDSEAPTEGVASTASGGAKRRIVSHNSVDSERANKRALRRVAKRHDQDDSGNQAAKKEKEKRKRAANANKED